MKIVRYNNECHDCIDESSSRHRCKIPENLHGKHQDYHVEVFGVDAVAGLLVDELSVILNVLCTVEVLVMWRELCWVPAV